MSYSDLPFLACQLSLWSPAGAVWNARTHCGATAFPVKPYLVAWSPICLVNGPVAQLVAHSPCDDSCVPVELCLFVWSQNWF